VELFSKWWPVWHPRAQRGLGWIWPSYPFVISRNILNLYDYSKKANLNAYPQWDLHSTLSSGCRDVLEIKYHKDHPAQRSFAFKLWQNFE
jgi:hypothetical protein